jgi:hypothetical protein
LPIIYYPIGYLATISLKLQNAAGGLVTEFNRIFWVMLSSIELY